MTPIVLKKSMRASLRLFPRIFVISLPFSVALIFAALVLPLASGTDGMLGSAIINSTDYDILLVLLCALILSLFFSVCATLFPVLFLGAETWIVDDEEIRIDSGDDNPVIVKWSDVTRVDPGRFTLTIHLENRDHYSVSLIPKSQLDEFVRIHKEGKAPAG